MFRLFTTNTAISPSCPKVYFQNEKVEIVSSFKYLGVEIRTKLGWSSFISQRLSKIRNIYNGLRKMFRTIPLEKNDIRKKLFCAFALPHFFWLFATWFYFTDNQKQKIEHLYCAGIRLINNLWGWDDYVTLVLAQEKSLLDYVYDYWQKFMKHLTESPEGNGYRETWEAYLICSSPDNSFYKMMGLRKNNFFMNRYAQRAHHTNLDIFSFFCVHEKQKNFFQKTHVDIGNFIHKYIDQP